jgi:anti-anti-sigma factor
MRREVTGWARRTGLTADETDDLQLAVGEAVANAVEHAYAAGEPGEVRYRLTAVTGAVQVEVADDGRWQPPGDPGYRGRGLLVIQGLGEALDVQHGDAGTRVRFVLPTGSTAPVAPLPVPVVATGTGSPDELRLSGELDLASVPELRDELLAGAKAATGPVVVDLTGVTYLASAGVSLLVELVDAAPGRVLLRADADGPVGRVLRLTGLDRHLVP